MTQQRPLDPDYAKAAGVLGGLLTIAIPTGIGALAPGLAVTFAIFWLLGMFVLVRFPSFQRDSSRPNDGVTSIDVLSGEVRELRLALSESTRHEAARHVAEAEHLDVVTP